MLTVGLTGSSGSGKGYISLIFGRQGIPCLDTDAVCHDVYLSGHPCCRELTEYFGSGILDGNGNIDRKKLGNVVYSDNEKYKKLNEIAHRHIKNETVSWLKSQEMAGCAVAVIDAPMLFESGFNEMCDVTVGVICDNETRISRLAERDGIGEKDVLNRLTKQKSDIFFRENCSFLLDNSDANKDNIKEDAALLAEKLKKMNQKGYKKMDSKELKEALGYTNKSAFDTITEDELDRSFAFAEGYKLFLDSAKTEREAVAYGIKMAEKKGYTEYKIGDELEVGGRYYCNNRDKALYLIKMGEEPLENGVYILAAHVDSPRLDLKQNPLYEEGGFGLLKTHYYGGIKKYQWTTVPLALHGVIFRADGTKVEICIGEDDDEPIFYISDLLPHLAKEQMSKTLAEGIKGEGLNIILGSEPYRDEETSDAIKLNLLRILNSKYGITEEDFLTAELTAVPAMKARDVGLDRSLIAGYGHDDRCCTYPEMTALFDSPNTEKTVIVVLADKEEIGSIGVSGMQSAMFTDILQEICDARGANYRVVKAHSKCLSADVNNAHDPNFADVDEPRNASHINRGVAVCKFTGSRGKSGTSDATAEFASEIRRLFNEKGVVWQMAELGKIDQGGGGTVAMYIANHNIDTIDVGVPVVSMHAPYEVISKLDLYMTYKAFYAFVD